MKTTGSVLEKTKVFNSVLELIGNTPMVKLNSFKPKKNVDFYAKLELWNPSGSCKDRIGLHMINEAERKGLLKKGYTIIEATAGNTGLGVALAAIGRGYRIVFVVPTKFSIEKISLMKALGAEIVQTPKEFGMAGANEKVEELLKTIPNSYALKQFENQGNPDAHYLTTGPEIYEEMGGEIDYFIAGAGTGGTYTGIMKYLKEKNQNIKGVLADPVGSIIGGGNEHAEYEIEGVGNDFIPDTMDISLVDIVKKITDDESFELAREITRKEGIICGSSSGAILAAGLKLSEDIDHGNIVLMFADRGDRYFSKHLYE